MEIQLMWQPAVTPCSCIGHRDARSRRKHSAVTSCRALKREHLERDGRTFCFSLLSLKIIWRGSFRLFSDNVEVKYLLCCRVVEINKLASKNLPPPPPPRFILAATYLASASACFEPAFTSLKRERPKKSMKEKPSLH